MNVVRRNTFADIVSAMFILLFVYAAVSKVQDFQRFQVELGKSPILYIFSDYVAWLIPALEIIISILLIIKRLQYLALYISFSLMVVFSGYIVAILKFTTYIPCSCGGILQNMSWGQHLVFNIAFVVLGATAILLYPKNSNQDLIRDKKGN